MTCAIGVIMILTANGLCYAQSTKQQNGLNFQVPEDWPIEKRGGLLAPIPTEEYISIKFKATEEEFQTIKTDLISKFEELQQSIKNMESNFSKGIQKAQTQAENQVGAGTEGDLTDIQVNLTRLESEVERLDRKITNKTASMKVDSEETAALIRSLEKKIKDLQAHIDKLDGQVDYVLEGWKDSQ
jgi:hypothetical protein